MENKVTGVHSSADGKVYNYYDIGAVRFDEIQELTDEQKLIAL